MAEQTKEWVMILPNPEAVKTLAADLDEHRLQMLAGEPTVRVYGENEPRIDIPNQWERYSLLQAIDIEPHRLPSELVMALSHCIEIYLRNNKTDDFAKVLFEDAAEEFFSRVK